MTVSGPVHTQARDLAVDPTASAETAVPPICRSVDLEIHAETIRLDGGQVLQYTLISPSGVVPFQGQNFRQPLKISPQRFQADWLERVEKLNEGKELDGEQVLREEIPDSFEILGQSLYRQLFPADLQRAYRRFREPVETLVVVSDEPWIPWEWIKPFDDSDPDDIVDDDFLCMQFRLTRWLAGAPEPVAAIRVARIVRISVEESKEGPQLSAAEGEHDGLKALAERAETVDLRNLTQARHRDVVDLLSAGELDVLHFAGHGDADPEHADDAWVELADRRLRALRLDGPLLSGVKKRRPFIFLNACRAAQQGWAVTGLGGWAEAWVKRAECGAFVAPQWPVRDRLAGVFADAFYRALAARDTMARAAQKARIATRSSQPGHPAWLAYAVYAHPDARVAAGAPDAERRTEPRAQTRAGVAEGPGDSPLTLAERSWNPGLSPGTLLQAEYGVVPFHGRDQEVEDLRAWCVGDVPVAVRLVTGPGGMGKTRLAIEICRRMRKQEWQAGLVPYPDEQSPDELWRSLEDRGGPRLVVIDYAETRRELLSFLLRRASDRPDIRVRFLLLARAALDWWDQLKAEGGGVGDLLTSRATSQRYLQPLALSREERGESYRQAAEAFAERLRRPPETEEPEDLAASYYDRVLLLHMSALIAIEDDTNVRGEDGVLDRVLARERRFWHDQAAARGLPPTIVPGIGRAMAVITLAGGADTEVGAIDRMRSLHLFADQTRDVLSGVARMLHECYPGSRWIVPVMPDLLGEHLIYRELERCEAEGSEQAVFDELLGPRTCGDGSASSSP